MRAGVIVESLGMSQDAYEITRELNKISKLDKYYDIIVFYNDYDRLVMPPKFAMLQDEEMWGFDAPVIATNLYTANRLLSCPGPTKKYLYLWDLEWIHTPYYLETISPVYMNKDLQLIARSNEHSDIISKCWKDPVQTIENFNYEKIANLISQ